MMRKIHYAIATTFGAGYSPTAPGTAGTILAWLAAYFLFQGSLNILIIATIVATVIGTISANFVEKDAGMHDPSIVVIDEVAGMWMGLWLVPMEFTWYLVAFGLFRLFDVTKLFPINKLQDLPGGWGIMLDDIGAGIYTMIVIQIALYIIG